MNEDDLQSVFAQLRGDDAPPLRLTPDAVLAAGQRIRRRQRVMAAGIAVVVAVAVAPALVGLRGYVGDRPTPIPPVAPPNVVRTARPSPLPTSPEPLPSPKRLTSGTATPPMTPLPSIGSAPWGSPPAMSTSPLPNPPADPRPASAASPSPSPIRRH